MSYLDETGLSYFWGKIKSLVSSKMDKSTYDPQNKAQDVFGYVDSVAEGLIEYVEFTYVSGNNPDTVSSSRTFTEVKESINSGRLVLGRYGNYFYSVVSHDNSSVTFLCVTAVNYARTIILTLTNSASATYSNQNPLLKSGGTMTGPLTLSGDPAEDLQAAPKQYVDSRVSQVTAAQVGAYTKEETISADTKALFDLPASTTPDDAFRKLATAVAETPSSYYTSKYSGEEIDALLDWVAAQQEESP